MTDIIPQPASLPPERTVPAPYALMQDIFAPAISATRLGFGAFFAAVGDHTPTRNFQAVCVPATMGARDRYDVFAGRYEADKRRAAEGLSPAHFVLDLCPGFGASTQDIVAKKLIKGGSYLAVLAQPDAGKHLHYALQMNSMQARRFTGKKCAHINGLWASEQAGPANSLSSLIHKYQPPGTEGVAILAHQEHIAPLLKDAAALACVREIVVKATEDAGGVIAAFHKLGLNHRPELSGSGWLHFQNTGLAAAPV